MAYFCFIECGALSVPHMEPLIAEDAETAMAEARDLMGLHFSAISAHVFEGERRIGSVLREDRPR